MAPRNTIESVKFSNVAAGTHGRTAVVTARWSLVAESVTRRRPLAAALAG